MSGRFDVIVVGVGAMGSSACWHMARTGELRVLGLEQFDIPNNLGSSHGESRAIRLAYSEHPDYVPLLRRAYELWDELERQSGQKVLFRTGGLYLSPPGGHIVANSADAARRYGIDHELLDPAKLKERFPMFVIPDDWSALFEPAGGFLLPEKAIAAMAGDAVKWGAEIHPREPVLAWQADEHGTTARTERGTYEADRLIFCCGAWTSKIVADLSVPLQVTRQVMGWVEPKDPAPFALGRFPIWNIEKPDGTLYYGFPLDDAGRLKVAHHGPQTPTDPDSVERDSLPGDEETFRPALSEYLPLGDGPLREMRICLYTNSPDQHFILDRHPHFPRVTLACGFSGHGFKFASVIGDILMDLSLEGKSELPVEFLSLKRFKK